MLQGGWVIGQTSFGGMAKMSAPRDYLIHCRQMFSANKAAMLLIDLDSGAVVDASAGACKYYGYSLPELTALTIFDINILSQDETVVDILKFRTESKDSSEFQQRLASGEVRDVEVYSTQIHTEERDLLYLTIYDITERKQIAEALEAHLIALTQPLGDMETITFETLFDLGDIQHLQDAFSDATGVAAIITHVDGSPITKASNFTRLCGEIIRSSKKGCENCFLSAASLGRLHTEGPMVQPCLSAGLWDAGTSISVGGKHIANWLIGQVRDGTQDEDHIRSYAREIEVDEEEAVAAFNEVPAMSHKQFSAVANALFVTAKQLSNTAFQNVRQARYISERDRAESNLRRAQKMDALGQLTSGISHDFNNVLGIILGNVSLLERYVRDNEKALQRVDTIKSAACRAADLTSRLLGFSRIQTSEVAITNINETIENMGELASSSVTPEVTIEYKLAPELWLTEVNLGELQDTLLNLIINARDAMPGGGRISVETNNCTVDADSYSRNGHVKPGKYVELTISDTGSGISEEQIDSIFEPFYTTKPEGKGTGLGLAMVFGFTQRSNGHIEVQSSFGVGTSFRIYLPRNGGVDQSNKEGEQQSERLPRGSETILVVDDEKGLLDLAQEILRELGYRVLTASDGLQALEIIVEERDILLLFSDVVMPSGIDGYELSEQATTIRPDLKVLLTSGYTEKTAVSSGQVRVNENLLRKPYNLSEMAQKVRELLDE